MYLRFCIVVLSLVCVVMSGNSCYWDGECYQLFSSKTPYDSVRGDIRDQVDPPNCQPISVWTIGRHGNRNPSTDVTAAMKAVAELRDYIISSFEAGRSQLCAQDIEQFRKWKWNDTLDESASYLTGFGYEELYNIGRRLRERFPQLLTGPAEDFYFRPTKEQRTVTSAIAFVHGLTDGTNLSLVIDDYRERDEVVRTYENCDIYQRLRNASEVDNALARFADSPEYKAVQNAVQKRLGITTQLSTDDIYALYEICRFYRSWSSRKQSPWCAVFSNEDLVVLEYKDDLSQYYTNGYKLWINTRLGGPALKDLYEKFEAAIQGRGMNIVSYFTHHTMMEMVFCALEMYKDATPLQSSKIDPDRLWRTSEIAALATNLIAVLYSCQESDTPVYMVQMFHNEKLTELCPDTGCPWEQFRDKLQPFINYNLDFCSLNYTDSVDHSSLEHRS